jgi:hypothetical protein
MQNRRSNLQFQIGCEFEYDTCRLISQPRAKELFVETWLAGKAFLDQVGIPIRPQ